MPPLSLRGEMLLMFHLLQLPCHLPVPCREVTGEGMETPPELFPSLSSKRLYHQPGGKPKTFQGRFGPHVVWGWKKGPFSHTLVPVLPFGFAFAAEAA